MTDPNTMSTDESNVAPRRAQIQGAKLSRWIDLLAALLASSRPQTFKELARKVPAYLADGSVQAGEPSETLKRMFERDKDELRKEGVPIESIGSLGEESSAYALHKRDFYLPYLGLVTSRGATAWPAKIDRFGYKAIEALAFEPDELQVIGDAATRVLQVGDAMLADHARSAMRKLAFDLPVGATAGRADDVLVPPVARADSRVLSTLGDALFARKRVSCAYHSMGAAAASTRTVEPYGLFFISGHWYLVARDVEKEALRNFRVSRMAGVSVNTKKKDTPDFDIPADFSLREHAASRRAWELGDLDSLEALVEFRGTTGAVKAASALGRPDAAGPTFRRFDIRRADSFARWLLSFAGDAVPVAPDSLVREYRDLVQHTRALYANREVPHV
jgi:predicted DNA-binding transcriptional regulator YafY